MYLPTTRFSGDFSAQSEATAMKRVRAASCVHPSSDAAAYRDHGAMGGTEAEVASVGSMPQKSPTSQKAAFFTFSHMSQVWFTHDSSPSTQATAMTRASATSCVYGLSWVVVDTDEEAVEGSEIVTARVVNKRQKRPTASFQADFFLLFRKCHNFASPMIPRHPPKQQQ